MFFSNQVNPSSDSPDSPSSTFHDLNTNILDSKIRETYIKIQKIMTSSSYQYLGIGITALQNEITTLSLIKENIKIPPSKEAVDKINRSFRKALHLNPDKKTKSLIEKGLYTTPSRPSDLSTSPDSSVSTTQSSGRSKAKNVNRRNNNFEKVVYTRESNCQFSLSINGKIINFQKAPEERNGAFDQTFLGIGEHHKISVKIAELLPNRNMEAIKKETQFLLDMNGSNHVLGASEAIFTGKHQFLIMNEIVGESLIRKMDILTLKQKISILKDIIRGLEELHNAGILHRDLNLENVIVDTNNKAKLMNLGFAKEIKERTTDLPGVSYPSPEMLAREEQGPPSDIFAFGLLMNALLTKARLNDTSDSLKLRIHRDTLPNIKYYNKIPFHVRGSIHKLAADCLKKDPTKRPSTIKILSILEEILNSL